MGVLKPPGLLQEKDHPNICLWLQIYPKTCLCDVLCRTPIRTPFTHKVKEGQVTSVLYKTAQKVFKKINLKQYLIFVKHSLRSIYYSGGNDDLL